MIDTATLLYNLVMIVVDLAALVVIRRSERRVAAWGASLVGLAIVSVVLAGIISLGSTFDAMRLLAWGVFLHGPIFCVGSALVWGRARWRWAVGCLAMAIVLMAVAVDAFLIEPKWLEVSHREIHTAKVSAPIRIVVLADLQTDQVGAYEQEVIRRALAEKPDLILLAGDYLQPDPAERVELNAKLNTLLRQSALPGPDRIFAVGGNIDGSRWPGIFHDTPVVTVHSTESFELDGVRLTCLGVRDSFNTSLEVPGDADRFHVVLGHSPNFALGRVEAELLVAGHTHGGQVRLPFVGPLKKATAVPRSWAAGWTDLPGGGRLLVSRGVGMERSGAPRLRFLCRPELVVIDVVPDGG